MAEAVEISKHNSGIYDVERTTTIESLPAVDEKNVLDYTNTLGSVRLHHAHTNEIILVPQPSNDPNDPLNWSTRFRYYNAVLVCMAMIMCNFLAAGPTIAIVDITIDLVGPPGPTFVASISKVAFFFTTTSLMQGVGNLFWMPLILKYGRRPCYVISFATYTVTAIWAGVAKTYGNELAARIVMGLAAGSGECLAPLTIADIFFLHERGMVMALYTASLNFGVSLGIIIAGLVTIDHSWRYIYYVATALIGGLTLLVFFTMPETSYNRSPVHPGTQASGTSRAYLADAEAKPGGSSHDEGSPSTKRSYLSSLRLYEKKLTSESLGTLFLRPIVVLMLPPVLWATLVMSVEIGFLVAISSNYSSAFQETYNFQPWQVGLCFIAGFIGSGIGIFFGGHFTDWVANYFTKRNGGIREPEFRLPAISIGLVTTPLALVLYGVGIQHKLHWMCPTVGLGLLNFSIAQATNVSLVYVIDAYRPIAGEAVVSQLAFKACFGFLLSFYTNPWIAGMGYQGAFGTMAGIAAAVLLCWIPFFIYGKRIRQASLNWPFIQSAVMWHVDREVGE
ncbi:hypothetical protein LTR36_001159 [Oleoguttula mirabilis]|uniref:Major facilitator superfamily (MFS) profile domain-containing protein n=1 Tax=Oleoguttula mirabilis TaxID=1507867 RepID=A0AAV9J3E1_9PEZI|nr:hypothetical protein LTR36_001159 [Oleoguttula mirabilis]